MSSSLKNLEQQLYGYDLSAENNELVYDLVCEAYELGKKSKVEEDFYEFPVPSPGNDFEDFDERYLLLGGKTLRLVHEKYSTLETTMAFNDNEYGLKYSNILSWVREDEDDVVWTAVERASSEDSGWKAYVSVDIASVSKQEKTLASTLAPGTLFLGKVEGVTRNLLTTSKHTLTMTCVPIGNNTGYDPKDVEVVEVLATGIPEEGIWF